MIREVKNHRCGCLFETEKSLDLIVDGNCGHWDSHCVDTSGSLYELNLPRKFGWEGELTGGAVVIAVTSGYMVRS